MSVRHEPDPRWRQFQMDGFARLASAFPQQDATSMQHTLWGKLGERYGIVSGDHATWRSPLPSDSRDLFEELKDRGTFDRIGSTMLVNACNVLLGDAVWVRPPHWFSPLVTFPNCGRAWDVPSLPWHLDFPVRRPVDAIPGLRVLAFIGVVSARAGGTLVMAGSHRIIRDLLETGRDLPEGVGLLKTLARQDPWLQDLLSHRYRDNRVHRFMTEGATINGVAVRVMELTGKPGDIVVMHPWLLHSAAPNCGTAPRFMAEQSVYRRKTRWPRARKALEFARVVREALEAAVLAAVRRI